MPDPKRPSAKPSHKFSDYFYNWVSYCGAVLAMITLVAELCLFGIDFFSHHGTVYLGIFTYILLPPFLIIGLLLIPFGAIRKRRQVLRGKEYSRPKALFIDPSLPTHRNAVMVFLLGTTILIIMTAVGSYKAFHHTESVEFCGTTCHAVMKPEYTAYQQSSHARVKCVECHIGSGADWYVRSKLSGLRQVYKTIVDEYPRPIPTPVKNLRPAEETCEQCHWPGKFYSSVELRKNYFPRGEADYPSWRLRMLMQVGGASENQHGIHAHMNLDNEIFYVAEDERRQEISWVKSVHGDGTFTVYTPPGSPYREAEPPADKIRKMDCIDCHNRPTHNYNPPTDLVNAAIYDGDLPARPEVKEKVLELMSAEYASEEEAVTAIRAQLKQFLRELPAEEGAVAQVDPDKSADAVVEMFKGNIFPEMKARWDAYPNNIGHMVTAGCFRCHGGEHESDSGDVISRDCRSCHTIIEQGPPGAEERSTEGLDFRHPFDEHDLWQDMQCSDCHSGN